MTKEKLIYSFDLGIGSSGECVRRGNDIKHIQTLLLPAEFASTTERAKRWRMIRSREAHKAREEWWRKIAKKAGIEVLSSKQPGADLRLLKEFPAKGEDVIYTSSLLRIALLQGKKLQPWQIYKAVWSAIQHRGYDPDPAWKRKPKQKKDEEAEGAKETVKTDDEEKENQERLDDYTAFLKSNIPDKYHYPCYYDAMKMGLWSPRRPEDLSKKIGSHPTPCRGRTAPRELVEKELRQLLSNASKQFPYLKDKIDFVLYGEAGKPYASFTDPSWRHIRGRKEEWHGVLGQKVPRFDNRIIAKCRLIPRMNTCRTDDFLAQEVAFLMSLKNVRYISLPAGSEEALTPEQIRTIFESNRKKLIIDKTKSSRPKDIITPTEWRQWLCSIGAIPSPAQPSIPMPRIGGRSRFSRPALRILREILLSGQGPKLIHDQWVEKIKRENPDNIPMKGLILSDLRFLLDMPPKWENFWIPDNREEFSGRLNAEQKEKIFQTIISKVNNPKIRHRLWLFRERLELLSKKYGKPDLVVIEIVRDDFMGPKRKREYEQFMLRMQKERADARQKADDCGLRGRDAFLKLRLHGEQKGIDLYSGVPISNSQLDHCQIDHIVPRAMGGPDALYNKVLTSAKNNEKKGNRTPYQWFKDDAPARWDDYIKMIEGCDRLSKKKRELLTTSDPVALVEKYTSLAETAYMVQLARKVVCLVFGWAENAAGLKNQLRVVSGGDTARLRRQLKLDSILHPNIDTEKIIELTRSGKMDKKNRENPRHHALDAVAASIIPEIHYDIKNKKDIIPSWFTREYCVRALKSVYPPMVRYEKPALAQTIYGIRKNVLVESKNGKIEKRTVYVGREALKKTVKIGNAKDFFDLSYAQKNARKIVDPKLRTLFREAAYRKGMDQERWTKFMHDQTVGIKKVLVIESEDGEHFKEIRHGSGQYFQSVKHKGFIVGPDESGRWQTKQVYAFERLPKHVQEGASMPPYFLRSGQLLQVGAKCNLGTKNEVMEGVYYLLSIQNGAYAKIAPVAERKRGIIVNIHVLFCEGKTRPI